MTITNEFDTRNIIDRSKTANYLDVFSMEDWYSLDNLVAKIKVSAPHLMEHPQHGDSQQEPINLDILRLINRKNGYSRKVNTFYSNKFLKILNQAGLTEAIMQNTGMKDLAILRMQLNIMRKNSFVGLHKDSDNDPIYLLTAIIRTQSDFTGGELIIYNNHEQIIRQKNHSVFLMDASIAHEVKSVTEGYRDSLIVLLGK